MGCNVSSSKASSKKYRAESKPCQYLHETDFRQEYKLGDLLGKGSFASVYSCKSEHAKDHGIAVKIVDCNKHRRSSQSKKTDSESLEFLPATPVVHPIFRREATMWRALGKHANIVELFAAYEGVRYGYLTMELCGLPLVEAFAQADHVSEPCIEEVAVGMLKGVQHVHTCRIIHRDIKPQHFLTAYSCDITKHPQVKLADFGLAVCITGITREDQAGTTQYMAPEMLSMEPFNEKVDMWSLGVTLYLMLFGRFPYKPCAIQPKEVPSYKATSGSSECWPQPSEKLSQLLNTFLARDYEQRPSAAEAIGRLQVLEVKASSLSLNPTRDFLPTLRNAHQEIEAASNPKDKLSKASTSSADNQPAWNRPLPSEFAQEEEAQERSGSQRPYSRASDTSLTRSPFSVQSTASTEIGDSGDLNDASNIASSSPHSVIGSESHSNQHEDAPLADTRMQYLQR